jgi:omega-amidase
MRIELVQYNPNWEEKTLNQEKIESLMNSVTDCDLIIFPEMTLTGFSMNPEKLAEEKEGKSLNFFSELAKKHSANIFAGIIEKDNQKYFNSLLHINTAGEIVRSYRKIHPFSYSEEDKHYTAGEIPVVTEINDWKIGLSICYDLRFPELYRFYAKERVKLIVVIANWPVTRIEHWRTLLKARAIENQCYVAGVNRTGSDPMLKYNGFSSVYDPMGKEIISLEDEEKIISADIDKEKVDEVRNSLPFLNDIHLI